VQLVVHGRDKDNGASPDAGTDHTAEDAHEAATKAGIASLIT
jgi:hypothetical protein